MNQRHPAYGYIEQRHLRKVLPWLVRLETATDGLNEDAKSGDRGEVLKSLEDVNFWRGRLMGDLLSSSSAIRSRPELGRRAVRAFAAADQAVDQAQKSLLGAGRGYGQLEPMLKSQDIRLMDVFLIGPVMILAAHRLARRHRALQIGLYLFGTTTVWYNLWNFIRYKRLEEANG